MKIKTACCLLVIIVLLSSCGPAWQTQKAEDEIGVYAWDPKVDDMINLFLVLHPDFGYKITTPYIIDGTLAPLDTVLGGSSAPDIYLVYDNKVTEYTQGGKSGYAMPYEELGIDVDAEIQKAGIFQYIVDLGTRPSDGKVVGLGFESTACALFYRRSIAKEIWGTDDPAVIKTKIGPGWDEFIATQAELKAKGYWIISESLLVGGKLYIDPQTETQLDFEKARVEKDPDYRSRDYTKGAKVFGTFGPANKAYPLMNESCKVGGEATAESWGDWAVCELPGSYLWGDRWVLANKELANDPAKKAAVAEFIDWMTLQCDENSLQYHLANGTLWGNRGAKEAPASRTVMEMSDGTMDFLGGQNIFDVYMPAGESVKARDVTQYTYSDINDIWVKYIFKYADGEYTRDEAIAAFKQEVKKQLGIEAW